MCIHSTIVSYVLLILSCTMCYFRFVCTLFILFCLSDTNIPRPCSTNEIGASHHFPYFAAPKEPTVALLFRRPQWRFRKGPSKSAPASVAWYGQEGEAPIKGEFGTFGEAAAGDRRLDSRCVRVSATATTVATGRITVGGASAASAAAAAAVPGIAAIFAKEFPFLPKIADIGGRRCQRGPV